jgi:hypothetical protein
MTRFWIVCFAVLLLGIGISSCGQEDPALVSTDFFPPTSLVSISDSLPNLRSVRNDSLRTNFTALFGIDTVGGRRIQATSYLKFSLITAPSDSLLRGISATLVCVQTALDTSRQSIGLNVFRVDTAWQSADITPRRVLPLAEQLGSGTVRSGTTDTLRVSLPAALADSMVAVLKRGGSDSLLASRFSSVALVPTSGSVISQFNLSASYIDLTYTQNTGTTVELRTRPMRVFNAGYAVQTSYSRFADDAIYLASSTGDYSVVNFRLDPLFAAASSSTPLQVTNATIVLTRDTTDFKISRDGDRVLLNVNVSTDSTLLTNPGKYGISTALSDTITGICRLDVTSIIQRILSPANRSEYRGFLLSPVDNVGFIKFWKFHGSQAAPAVRPRLVITYSLSRPR